ncbi:MAG: SDR family oxidoreductase [Microcystis panniformis WG22]|uniref:SDR family oxidoreductase n=1 Tax=Microcystis aeruginosa Ma_MB_F_20061100_S20D TaxID=2486253 RepID=A0A552EL63_MICAE|nr:SDR family oxidoreductase [Microcystis panniformis WG22]TRU35218.1 MAG: SDR family oxidoreductase [Microcystis aeruginosa Ma_MB_F_20061100_S20D]TRU43307.1 MAG: SDR family oxidoreductase [Microcystis aeruginosa Ma_MB_F_20061100_S20]
MKAFVAGATGETGRRIVAQLVERQIPVRALVRNPEKAAEILPAGVEIVVGDVQQADKLEALIADCSVLLCATGPRPSFNPTEPLLVDYLGTKNLIDAAKKKGIEHFVLVTSLCVSNFFHPLNLFWLILFWKKQAEDYLINSGLTYTIVRPGGLKNEDNLNAIKMSSADTLSEGSIPRTKVASVCVESLFYTAANNKILEIVAPSDATNLDWTQLFQSVG